MKIIKIGGSILTQKGIWKEIDTESVHRIADELSYSKEPFVIIHGLGTYGRSYVPLYEKRTIEKQNITLAKDIQVSVKHFHYEIMKILLQHNLPVRSIDPKSVFVCQNKKIVEVFPEAVDYYLNHGCIPVLHGDTVWDESGNYYLLSSDDMLESLANELLVSEVIWATDVDGVYAKADSQPLPVMQELHKENLEDVWKSEYDVQDVTGGMMNKIKISFHLSDVGVTSHVLNGKTPGNIRAAFENINTNGTKIW